MELKYRHIFYPFIIILFFSSASIASDKGKRISENIRSKYESVLFSLEPGIQKHFAVRMYRLTGDEKYIYPIIFDLLISVNKLKRHSENIEDTIYIKNQAKLLLDKFNPKTRKGKKRRELFAHRDSILYYLETLYNLNKLAGYHLAGLYGNLFQIHLAALKQFDFKSFLLAPAVLRNYAPQAVNYIYYLKNLQIADIRSDYKLAFMEIYADSLDDQLTDDEFMDKIYGLTHFITAASGYYQHSVDSTEFLWILNYFETNIKRIIEKTKPDIIAEVGICFLLCNHTENKAIDICRKAIIRTYNKKHQMILSTKGSAEPARGEHRNILAIMLLNWPDSLYPGPYLNNFIKFNKLNEHQPLVTP